MRSKVLLLIFFIVANGYASQPINNLIILNDGTSNTEHIASDNKFLLTALYSAFEQEACPILMSCSLWQYIQDIQHEFKNMSQIEGSPEWKIQNYYSTVIQRINKWFAFYGQHSSDPCVIKELVVEQINKEFHSEQAIEEQKNKNTFIQEEDGKNAGSLYVYTQIPFKKENWHCWKLGEYLLFIPKKVSEHYKQSLAVDKFEFVSDATNSMFFGYVSKPDLLSVLNQLFIPNNNTKWNVFLSGHGAADLDPMLANLSISEFKKLLTFFNTTLHIHSFSYQTCFGTGVNADKAFQTEGRPDTFHFPIISFCFPDVISKRKLIYTLYPGCKASLRMSHLKYDNKEKSWGLQFFGQSNWKKYFKYISKKTIDQQSIERTRKLLFLLTLTWIDNLPFVRFAGSAEFVPCYYADYYSSDVSCWKMG